MYQTNGLKRPVWVGNPAIFSRQQIKSRNVGPRMLGSACQRCLPDEIRKRGVAIDLARLLVVLETEDQVQAKPAPIGCESKTQRGQAWRERFDSMGARISK